MKVEVEVRERGCVIGYDMVLDGREGGALWA